MAAFRASFARARTLNCKKKNLVYLTPAEGYFLCSFHFNEKGRELARQSDFKDDILKSIEAGKENSAGHTFDVIVADEQGLELSKQLLKIKTASYGSRQSLNTVVVLHQA